MALKTVIRKLVPPIILDAARAFRSRPSARMPEYEYIPEGWARQDEAIKGWNQASVMEAYLKRWPDFVRNLQGAGPLGLSPEAKTASNDDIFAHNIMVSFAYALALATHGKSQVSFLDWGGGFGHYYLIAKAMLPGIEINYHCKDLPLLVEQGQKLLPEAHFYTDDAWMKQQYDFILASGALQFARDWQAELKKIASAANSYVLITRLPVVVDVPSFVVVQRPYAYGYNTEYLGWYLNRKEFLDAVAGTGLVLQREFLTHPRVRVQNAPEEGSYRGFLFKVPDHP